MKTGTLREALESGGFWTAWLLLVPAWMIPNPTPGCFLTVCAAVCAVFPVCWARGPRRLVAALALVLSLATAATLFGQAQNDPYYRRAGSTHGPLR